MERLIINGHDDEEARDSEKDSMRMWNNFSSFWWVMPKNIHVDDFCIFKMLYRKTRVLILEKVFLSDDFMCPN